MGLIDCLQKAGFLGNYKDGHPKYESNEKAKKYYLDQIEAYKKQGLDQYKAEVRVVEDLQQWTLRSLHDMYYQLGMNGYKTLFKDRKNSNFTTANGSTYVLDKAADGWISRRYHVNDTDKGTLKKESSDKTVFIKPENIAKAKLLEAENPKQSYTIDNGKISVTDQLPNGKSKTSVIPYEQNPKAGYHPLSVFKDRLHLGSPIAEVNIKQEDLPSIESLPEKEQIHLITDANKKFETNQIPPEKTSEWIQQELKFEDNGHIQQHAGTGETNNEQPVTPTANEPSASGAPGNVNAEGIPPGNAGVAAANDAASRDNEGSTGGERQAPEISASQRQDQVSGIKKLLIDQERNNLNLKREDFQKLSDDEIMAIGKAKVDSGEIDPKAIAKSIAEGKPRPLSAEETAAMVYYKTKLDNEYFEVNKKLTQAVSSGDEGDELVQRERLKQLDEERKNYFVMSDKTGFEQSQSFRLRKMLLDSEFNAAAHEMKYRANNNGEIPDTVKAKFAKLEQDYRNLQEEMKKIEEQRSEKAMSRFIANDQVDKYGGREKKFADLRATRQQAKNNILEKLKAQRNQLNSNPIPLEIIPDLATLAKTYIQEGFYKGEQIIDKIYNELKEHLPGVTKRDLRDAISGYGKEPQLTKDELNSKLNDAKRQMKLLSAIEDASKGKEPAKTVGKSGNESPEVKKLRNDLETEMKKAGIKTWMTDEQRLKAFRSRTQRAIQDYEQRLEKGDFSKRVNSPLPFTEEDIKLKAKLNKIRNEFEAEHLKLERAQRSKFEKILDFLAHLKREMVISSVTTIGKLATAGTLRMVQTPWENLNGQVLHMILPGISKKAMVEGGGFNPGAELAAIKKYGATWGQLFKGKGSMVDTITQGKSELDHALEEKHMSEELVSYVGRIHGALKDPVKQSEFIRAMKIQTDNALKNKIDLNNPVIQKTMVDKAYLKARSSIFTNTNVATEAYRNVISYLEHKGGVPGKVTAFLAKLEMPVVTVPANFANEILKIGYGSVHAMSTVLYVGAKNLSPENADYVMSCLKKQGIGIAMYTLGYLGYETIGGYYTGKRKEDEMEPGGLEVFGIHFPHWAIHSPMLEPLQMGATLKHMELEYERKGKEGGTVDGLYQATTGALKQIPFIETPRRLVDAIKNRQNLAGLAGDLVKGEVIPPDVQKLAAHFDTDENGKPIKRKPKGFIEHIETGVPGLRENVGDGKKFKHQ